MQKLNITVPVILAIVFLSVPQVRAQSFSCTIGRAACLDWGDKVCQSSAKCVSDDAVCFDAYTCGFQGFVCKSKFNEVIDEYDQKIQAYNRLVEKYNSLLEELRASADLAQNLESRLRIAKTEQDQMMRCVANAPDLDEAQDCRI